MNKNYIIIEEHVTLPVAIGNTVTAPLAIPIYIVFDPANNKIIGVFSSKEEASNKIEEINNRPKSKFGR